MNESDIDAVTRELFEQAYPLRGNQRTSFLATLPQEQRRGVIRLLNENAGIADAIMNVIRPNQTALAETKLSYLDDLSNENEALPTQIGPYKILQIIGRGGMGVVYMAEQSSPVRRRVALKVIKTDTATKEVLARFEAERQALSIMDHQNIARVLDVGVTDHGRPYFSMELVAGISVTEYCNKHKLTTSERLDIFIQVCRAIQHAHQKGVIHRDIKPSNVLVTQHGAESVVKVIDFGLAKAVQDPTLLAHRTLFTNYGQIIGTLEYMSPEQAEMNALDIDTRTDVYSLGILLFELLTGSTPLGRDRMKNEAFDNILRLIREEEVPRPSVRLSGSGDTITSISEQRRTDPKKLSGILKGDLDWIALKALDKDRSRRYDGPAALADDVVRYLSDEPVTARAPTLGYRLLKASRKHRGSFVVAGLVATVLSAALIGTSVMWNRARNESIRAQRAEVAMTLAKDAAERERDKALSAESQVKELTVRISDALETVQSRNNMHFALSLLYDAVAPQSASDTKSIESITFRVRGKSGTATELILDGKLLNQMRSNDAAFVSDDSILAELRTVSERHKTLENVIMNRRRSFERPSVSPRELGH